MTDATSAGQANLLGRIARDYWDGLRAVFGCPREIWVTYLVKILESLCYFSSVLVLMIFLVEDMGLSDVAAGTVFGVFSASMSFFMLFVGFVADSMGIKKSLMVGLVIAFVGRVAITFTTEPWIVYPGLLVLSIGFAYMIPLLAAAVKLFSTRAAQKYAFSWYYVIMNVGALVAGLSLDGLRTSFTESYSWQVLGLELVVRPIQVVFLVAVLATVISLVLVGFFVRQRIPLLEAERAAEQAARAAAAGGGSGPSAPTSPLARQKETAWEVMKEVTSERTFWVFITFIFLLVMVKMIFQYNHSLYPLYMERVGMKELTGRLYSINPFIIIFLVPVMTAITSRMGGYKVIVVGSFISAASVFMMGLGEAVVFVVLFQVVLSLGEAIYSPRLYDYTASIAPPGREATYMAYSKAPMFFAKVAAGPATGFLLAWFCPVEGPRNTELMWIIVGATTMISPITLLLGRRWLDVEARKHREAARIAGRPAV